MTEEPPLRFFLATALLVAASAWAGLPVACHADYAALKKHLAIGDPVRFSPSRPPTAQARPSSARS